MRLGSLALWVVISVALVIVGEAQPLGGLEEDEDEADDDEEENGENDPHDHPYCLTSQCVPEGKENLPYGCIVICICRKSIIQFGYRLLVSTLVENDLLT